MSILETIAARTRQRIEEERLVLSDDKLKKQAYEQVSKELETLANKHNSDKAAASCLPAPAQERFAFPFERALLQPGMSFICEVKKASPSKGIIAPDFPYLRIAQDYEAAGASALSCLTEPYWFKGSNEYLRTIADNISIPILRKDFTIDERMIYEAKVLGASAVLLICSLLSTSQLREYLDLAHKLGLSALVEAHSAKEIEQAKQAGARIIGVNNRNLATFEVDPENSLRLREIAGDEVIFVSESGIKTRSDVAALEAAGVDAVLIGESLMRSKDKSAKLDELRGKKEEPSPTKSIATFNNNPHKLVRLRESKADSTLRQAELHRRFAQKDIPCQFKACGMSRAEDIAAVNKVHPDMCGFIIEVPTSTRTIDAKKASDLIAGLDPSIFAVGVFVDAPLERITTLIDTGIFDAIQLHGHESDSYLSALKEKSNIPLIQAFRVKDEHDLERAQNSKADMVLLDSGAGSGKRFDWSLVKDITRPFILAGGLNPQNVAQALSCLHPWGVDMSSGLETEKHKDPLKLKAAKKAICQAF